MGINDLTGTPWHTERMHRAENDDRRYKGRCAYFEYEDSYCSFHKRRCTGSAHCDEYLALSDEDFNLKRKKKKSTEEIYWY